MKVKLSPPLFYPLFDYTDFKKYNFLNYTHISINRTDILFVSFSFIVASNLHLFHLNDNILFKFVTENSVFTQIVASIFLKN